MKEIRLDIANSDGTNSVTYREDKIYALKTRRKLFDGAPTVGNCVSGELEAVLDIATNAIPRNAKITPYVRDTGGMWKKKSEFFIFSRNEDKATGALHILAYDAIYKSETGFVQSGNIGSWPRTDKVVMREIASRTGATINSATLTAMNKAYSVQFPGITIEGTGSTQYKTDGTTTMREVAGRIASMYAGNWIIDNNGQWRLVILGDLPVETNLLIDENADYIKLGNDRILIVTGLAEPHRMVVENGDTLTIGGDSILV